jgi:hypothetical protein
VSNSSIAAQAGIHAAHPSPDNNHRSMDSGLRGNDGN